MAQDLDPLKLSSPRIFLVRMMVFLILCGLIVVVLYRQIWLAFLANPGLNVGGDAGAIFDSLKEGLAAPLSGMGISFSSSLFGLAGSLVLGFLDLQTSQAQNRFYTDLEDWLSTTVRDLGAGGEPIAAASGASGELQRAVDRLKESIIESGSGRAATAAMAS